MSVLFFVFNHSNYPFFQGLTHSFYSIFFLYVKFLGWGKFVENFVDKKYFKIKMSQLFENFGAVAEWLRRSLQSF